MLDQASDPRPTECFVVTGSSNLTVWPAETRAGGPLPTGIVWCGASFVEHPSISQNPHWVRYILRRWQSAGQRHFHDRMHDFSTHSDFTATSSQDTTNYAKSRRGWYNCGEYCSVEWLHSREKRRRDAPGGLDRTGEGNAVNRISAFASRAERQKTGLRDHPRLGRTIARGGIRWDMARGATPKVLQTRLRFQSWGVQFGNEARTDARCLGNESQERPCVASRLQVLLWSSDVRQIARGAGRRRLSRCLGMRPGGDG